MTEIVEQRHLRWAEKYPELGTEALPTNVFTSETRFGLEVERIFKRVWLQVGRVEEIANKGDYKVRRLPFAKTSAIVIRGADGVVRAFHNTCSHRGNKPITETGFDTFGHARNGHFECWFHGWVYDAQGRLAHVPEEDHFAPCFERNDNGLTPIACDVWEGFVFINLDPKPRETLAEFLGGLGKLLSGFPYRAMTTAYPYRTVLNCNWKIAIDAFSESYHVPFLHRYLWPEIFGTKLEGIKLLGPHRSSEVFLYPGKARPAVEQLANKIMHNSLGQERPVKNFLPPQINPDIRPDFAFEMSVFFPCFMVCVGEGTYFTHNFYPIAHDKCLWEATSYLVPARTSGQRFAEEVAEKLQVCNWLEDSATMEMTHDALESGAKDKFWLHDEEVLIRHSHAVVRRYLGPF